MKRIVSVLLVICCLAGCSSGPSSLNHGLSLRNKLMESQGFSFEAVICADFGKETYSFSVLCNADKEGNVSFSVLEPELICGISGTFSGSGGVLTFDDIVLTFPSLADGEVSPVSGPWLMINALLHGYIKGESFSDGQICLTIMDSFEEDALMLRMYLNENMDPVHCDLFWQGRSVLSMDVKNFRYL